LRFLDERLPARLDNRSSPLPPPLVIAGVYGPEPGGAGELFRWTGDCVEMSLEGPPRAARLSLDYACTLGLSQRLTVVVAGVERESGICRGDERKELRADILPGDWGSSAFLPVELRVDPALIPAESMGLDDLRLLGVRLHTVALEPPR